MLAKIEFFEVYRVLWVLEFVDTDLEDLHLQIKYFTSMNGAWVSVSLSCSGLSSETSDDPNSPIVCSFFLELLAFQCYQLCSFTFQIKGLDVCNLFQIETLSSLQLNKEGNFGLSVYQGLVKNICGGFFPCLTSLFFFC